MFQQITPFSPLVKLCRNNSLLTHRDDAVRGFTCDFFFPRQQVVCGRARGSLVDSLPSDTRKEQKLGWAIAESVNYPPCGIRASVQFAEVMWGNKKLDVVCACCTSTVGMETGGSLELMGQLPLLQVLVRDPVSKEVDNS